MPVDRKTPGVWVLPTCMPAYGTTITARDAAPHWCGRLGGPRIYKAIFFPLRQPDTEAWEERNGERNLKLGVTEGQGISTSLLTARRIGRCIAGTDRGMDCSSRGDSLASSFSVLQGGYSHEPFCQWAMHMDLRIYTDTLSMVGRITSALLGAPGST